MKKYILISFLLHLSVLLVYLPKANQSNPETFEIEMVEAGSEGNEDSVEVKEFTESADSVNTENLNFYWGLGISTLVYIEGVYISEVYIGYNGEKSGLKVEDIITHINGELAGEGYNIRGDGPGKLQLTILRKGVIIIVLTERGKVYY